MKTRTGYEILSAQIQEMDSVSSDDLVKIDKDLIKRVSEGDDSPLFVTMQILSEGVSKNRKNYTRELVDQVASEINAKRPNGYQGHLTQEERATKAPDPLVMWLGAESREENGKQVVYARGYVMPYAKNFRQYLKSAKALGKNVAMSIQGTASKALYNAQKSAYDLQGFVLDSVDFAREGSEGVPNNGTLILASEMSDEDKLNNGEPIVDKIQILQQTNISEMEQHNPTLVSEIKSQATDPKLVSEMQAIKELTGDEPAVAIAEMKLQIKAGELKNELNTKVKASKARPVIEGLVLSEMEANPDKAISEMVDSVLRSPDAVAVLEQFSTKEPKIAGTSLKKEAKAQRQFTVKRK